jgi:large subunit ribosomal protein L9
VATEGGIKEVKAIKEKLDEKKAAELQEAKDLAARLEGQEIVFYEKVGTEGRLFGAVTNKEICEQVNKQFNLNLDKKKFEIKDSIKHLGVEHCKIKIYPGVSAEIKVKVEAKE